MGKERPCGEGSGGRHADEQRARLADDVRRLAGFADAVAERARRLGAEVPEGVAACATVWWAWHRRLAEWARGSEPE